SQYEASSPLEKYHANSSNYVRDLALGIHAFGTGWIYNISGLWGVEIELKGGSLVRLGTDEPNYLCQAIMDSKGNLE
ncbi:hypothetical protein L9G74_11555, partial [Shewanella sp. C32]|nr:hypothetical protein [Shewanella electrica]MCS4557080.1 hypothetical protein [Shewanella electrica]